MSLWGDEVASSRVVFAGGVASALDQVRRTGGGPSLWYMLRMVDPPRGAAIGGNGSPLGSATLPRWWSVLLRCIDVRAVGGVCATVLDPGRYGGGGGGHTFGEEFLFHGSELRSYALLSLLSVAFALVLESACMRPTRGHLAALVAVVACGALTHYFFLLLVAAGLVWLGISGPRGCDFGSQRSWSPACCRWCPGCRPLRIRRRPDRTNRWDHFGSRTQ